MKIQTTTRRIKGLTLIEVLVVIVALFVFAAMFLINTGSHRKAPRIACVNNLKQVGLAFRIWAGDNGDKYPMEIYMTNDFAMKLMNTGNSYFLWQAMSNELSTPKILHCPADKQRMLALSFIQGFSDANISYFFGLDASYNSPQIILAGDDNLATNSVRVSFGILNLSTNSSVAWTKERHDGSGNILVADGSVQAVTSNSFKSALVGTNRLVIP